MSDKKRSHALPSEESSASHAGPSKASIAHWEGNDWEGNAAGLATLEETAREETVGTPYLDAAGQAVSGGLEQLVDGTVQAMVSPMRLVGELASGARAAANLLPGQGAPAQPASEPTAEELAQAEKREEAQQADAAQLRAEEKARRARDEAERERMMKLSPEELQELFDEGEDALKVEEDDGSSSLRA